MGVTNPCVPDKLRPMVREISAGGVVLRNTTEGWQMAVIEPQTEASATTPGQVDRKRVQKVLLALPKGLVDAGEKPEQTAIREVMEETGLTATLVTKLGDIKYVYVRSWGDRAARFQNCQLLSLSLPGGADRRHQPRDAGGGEARALDSRWTKPRASWRIAAKKIWSAVPRNMCRPTRNWCNKSPLSLVVIPRGDRDEESAVSRLTTDC